MIRSRLLWTLSLAVALVATVAAPAADPPPVTKTSAKLPAWDITRTSAPANVEDLRALEAVTKKVVEKCTPATVGVMIGMGAGSGVIVSEDGLVLTAAHVSGEPGKDCTLILPDGTRVKGKTLGTNDKLDSGMIKIVDKSKAKDGKWPFLPTAKSADLKKGQWVVSLGHPGGWRPGRQPVARLGQVIESQKDLIRTNCTLVGGDSGGPLFDLDGNVIGIHSRIGFTLAHNIHVPLDGFKAEWAQLTSGVAIGKAAKTNPTYFGASFVDESGNDVKGAKGPEITQVVDDSPAGEAGLRVGDEITSFDGTDVEAAEDVRRLLRRRKPGDEVEVVVQRGTRSVTLTVTLTRRP
ncbi:MAG TPA: trypsin-like peptidase domain-containing protein [Urbifossiella sp.]|nr:trypsin-like peptidase domain-containing protein [Urbifossiella sp.]